MKIQKGIGIHICSTLVPRLFRDHVETPEGSDEREMGLLVSVCDGRWLWLWNHPTHMAQPLYCHYVRSIGGIGGPDAAARRIRWAAGIYICALIGVRMSLAQ